MFTASSFKRIIIQKTRKGEDRGTHQGQPHHMTERVERWGLGQTWAKYFNRCSGTVWHGQTPKHLQAFQPFKNDLAQVCLHFHDRLLLLWRRWELTRPSGPGSDSSRTPAPEGTWRWSGTKTTGVFRRSGQPQAYNTPSDYRCEPLTLCGCLTCTQKPSSFRTRRSALMTWFLVLM